MIQNFFPDLEFKEIHSPAKRLEKAKEDYEKCIEEFNITGVRWNNLDEKLMELCMLSYFLKRFKTFYNFIN